MTQARAGAHRNGRLHHEQRAVGALRQSRDHGLDAAEIGIARRRRRRIDADERDLSVREQLGGIVGETQQIATLCHRLGRARLVDRHLTTPQALELRAVDVDAHDRVAELREADRRDEPDVADADHAKRLARAHGAPTGIGRMLFAIAIIVDGLSVLSSELSIQVT